MTAIHAIWPFAIATLIVAIAAAIPVAVKCAQRTSPR